MSFQLLNIVLFSWSGQRRVVTFRPGALNIITGRSETGKTALISIVDYCLGSSKCRVPEGEIRSRVAWYAITLSGNSEEHFVARAAPPKGQVAAAGAYYAVGSPVDIPAPEELAAVTNIDSVKKILAAALGIGLYVHEPGEGETRDELTVTLRHALAYVFQSQNEVSQQEFLFHRQGNSWVEQAIKDTLPYFLGAIGDDHVEKKSKLRALRRSLRRNEMRLRQLENIADGELGAAAGMLAEARDVGLIDGDVAPQSWGEAIEVLTAASDVSPEEQLRRYEETSDQAELGRLNERREELRTRLRRQRDELGAMIALRREGGGYAQEASEQAGRLSSLGVHKEGIDDCCPLCGTEAVGNAPGVVSLSAELVRVKRQLEGVAKNAPGLNKLIVEQQERVDETRRLLQENRSAMIALRSIDDAMCTLQEGASRRAHVLGRLSLFLESLPGTAVASELREEIRDLVSRIEQLASEIDEQSIEERLRSILSVLSVRLTSWAEKLKMWNSGSPFRLDPRRLLVVADTESGPVPMDRMGSGANWVGCHLIAHLALHVWFVQKARPVPRFLFLDQPSQVYFPEELVGTDGSVSRAPSEDRLAVVRMFELIREAVAESGDGFQVIVMEHADLDEEWFQEAVVEKWRDGQALIPDDWEDPNDLELFGGS